MAGEDYGELLRDPRWRAKRLEVLQREDFACERCEVQNVTLDVHHTYYEKGLMPWEYPTESLHVLCRGCHQELQQVYLNIKRALGTITIAEQFRVLSYIESLARERERSRWMTEEEVVFEALTSPTTKTLAECVEQYCKGLNPPRSQS